jgi:phosphohistidine phosphatase
LPSGELALYLVRHGLAAPPSTAELDDGTALGPDAQRPLTDEGIARIAAVAAGLKKLDVRWEVIVTSPLVRARQTAEVLAAQMKGAEIVISEALAPAASPATALVEILKDARGSRVALVGHEPNLGSLAAKLLDAREPIAFKKGAVCRFDFDEPPPKGKAVLRWFATPKMLRLIGRGA